MSEHMPSRRRRSRSSSRISYGQVLPSHEVQRLAADPQVRLLQ
jgi:hypothetical protein